MHLLLPCDLPRSLTPIKFLYFYYTHISYGHHMQWMSILTRRGGVEGFYPPTGSQFVNPQFIRPDTVNWILPRNEISTILCALELWLMSRERLKNELLGTWTKYPLRGAWRAILFQSEMVSGEMCVRGAEFRAIWGVLLLVFLVTQY